MGTTSTGPAAKRALVAGLEAAVPQGVAVFYGPPTIGEKARRQIVVGQRTVYDTQNPTIKAGRASRDEKYTIECWLVAAPARGTCEDADLLLEGMRAVLEEILASDKECAAVTAVWSWELGAAGEVELSMTNEGPLAFCQQDVTVKARLQGDD